MALLTISNTTDAGTAGATATPSASDTVDIGNGHNTVLIYRNTGSTPLVLTVVAPGTNDYGQPNPDVTITVPITTGEKWIPIRKDYDPGDGTHVATITATGTAAGQTVQVLRAL